MEAQLTGKAPATADVAPEGQLLSEAIRVFEENKQAQGLNRNVLGMHKRELKRLLDFSESCGVVNLKQALEMSNLIAYMIRRPTRRHSPEF